MDACICGCNKYSSLLRMDDCKSSVKNTPYIKEWVTQANISKEASTFETMDGQPQLLL